MRKLYYHTGLHLSLFSKFSVVLVRVEFFNSGIVEGWKCSVAETNTQLKSKRDLWSLRDRTAARKRWQNICVWQSGQGYYCAFCRDLNSLNIIVFFLSFAKRSVWRKESIRRRSTPISTVLRKSVRFFGPEKSTFFLENGLDNIFSNFRG